MLKRLLYCLLFIVISPVNVLLIILHLFTSPFHYIITGDTSLNEGIFLEIFQVINDNLERLLKKD